MRSQTKTAAPNADIESKLRSMIEMARNVASGREVPGVEGFAERGNAFYLLAKGTWDSRIGKYSIDMVKRHGGVEVNDLGDEIKISGGRLDEKTEAEVREIVAERWAATKAGMQFEDSYINHRAEAVTRLIRRMPDDEVKASFALGSDSLIAGTDASISQLTREIAFRDRHTVYAGNLRSEMDHENSYLKLLRQRRAQLDEAETTGKILHAALPHLGREGIGVLVKNPKVLEPLLRA